MPDARASLPPLCVDLDGTLVAADTLHESAWLLLRRKPWLVPLIPFWLLRGKAHLKDRIAAAVSLDCVSLPYRAELIRYLESQRGKRKLILATAANERIARSVATHLKIFDAVLASDARTNLKGATKLEVLRRHIGGEFDYIGDSIADLPVFAAARKSVLVHPTESVRARCKVSHVLEQGGEIPDEF